MRYVSVIKNKKNKPALIWLGIAAFFALFAAVYEYFSFGVYSANMIFAFVWPLLLGTVPCLILKWHPGRLYNNGVLLLLFGSVLAGVFEIYGTYSAYTLWIRLAGIGFVISGAALELIRIQRIKSAASKKKMIKA